MALGKNIRAARKKIGWRQVDLAKVIGAKSGETISQIEKGRREVMAWELAAIADALHIDFYEFLGPEELKFGPTPLWCPGER